MADAKPTGVKAADVAQIKIWLDRNEIVLVDVRETSEYEVEHIAGALLLPLSSFEPEFFPTLPGKKVSKSMNMAFSKKRQVNWWPEKLKKMSMPLSIYPLFYRNCGRIGARLKPPGRENCPI